MAHKDCTVCGGSTRVYVFLYGDKPDLYVCYDCIHKCVNFHDELVAALEALADTCTLHLDAPSRHPSHVKARALLERLKGE